MTRYIPALIIAALMLLCAWLYYRAHEAEEAAWRATCETVKWQTRANALECAGGRERP
jgi:Ser/Thr protein kinase RdoA (MazF antagonist)